MPRLKDSYKETVVPALMKEFGYKNVNQVPKLDKIVINMGMGDAKDDVLVRNRLCWRDRM